MEKVIDIRNVSLVRENHAILTDISWQVRSGEHWCVLGLNGSGKTMLLQILTGYLWPTAGAVSALGERFGEVDLRVLRRQIGWVSASLEVRLHGQETVRNIVLSGKFATIGLYDQTNREDVEHAVSWLRLLGCEPLLERRYATLSQGERQRVMIARALMASPRLLILDEPCNGLDILAREQLLDTIQSIAARPDAPTLIYVTHHVEEVVPCFTHTLLLKEGEVFASGERAEVLRTARLTEFFGVPVEVHERGQRVWVSVP